MKKTFVLLVITLLVCSAIAWAAAPAEVPYKTAVAPQMESAVVLDGVSEEWEDLMKFKADPLYTGDAFDVLPKSMLWMAWDANNLYFFVRVMDAKISVPKPEEFWAVDTVELFLDGDNKKGEGYDINDAQFWFCPGGEGLFIGQWKRPGDAIKETIYKAVPGVEGAVAVDDKGYTLEIKVSAAKLEQKAFVAGQKIGFNYTVNDLESGGTFWATSKAVNTFEHPNLWGTVTLVKS